MPYCTVPAIFGLRHWFETRFGGLCKQHDEYYAVGDLPRFKADCLLMAGMVNKGYPVLAFGTFLFVRVFGIFHYKRGTK